MKAPGNRKEIRGHVFTAGKQAFDVYASSAIFCRAQATMQGEYCRLYISWSCLCDHCASIGQGEYNPYQHNTNMQTPCAPMRPPQQNGSGLTHIVSGQQRLKQQVGCAPEQQSRTAGILKCNRSNVQGRAVPAVLFINSCHLCACHHAAVCHLQVTLELKLSC